MGTILHFLNILCTCPSRREKCADRKTCHRNQSGDKVIIRTWPQATFEGDDFPEPQYNNDFLSVKEVIESGGLGDLISFKNP